MHNESKIEWVRECINRQRLHQELFRVIHGRAGHLNSHIVPPPSSLDPRRALEWRQLSLSTSEQSAYRVRLRRWIGRLHARHSALMTASHGAQHSRSSADLSQAGDAAPAQSRRVLAEPVYNQSLRDGTITATMLRCKQKSGPCSAPHDARTVTALAGSATSIEAWDEAFAEGLKQQQLSLGQLSGQLAQAVDGLACTCRERRRFDPNGIINQLRNTAADVAAKELQSNLNSDRRSSLNELCEQHSKQLNDQAERFGLQLEALRSTLVRLTGSETYVQVLLDNSVHHCGGNMWGRQSHNDRGGHSLKSAAIPDGMGKTQVNPFRAAASATAGKHCQSRYRRGVQHRNDKLIAECDALRKQVSILAGGLDRDDLVSVVSDRDTLRKQVSMLMEDIERRVETECRLYNVNIQLRKRAEQLHTEVNDRARADGSEKRLQRRIAHFAIMRWKSESVAAAFRSWKLAYSRFCFRRQFLARKILQHHSYYFEKWQRQWQASQFYQKSICRRCMRRWTACVNGFEADTAKSHDDAHASDAQHRIWIERLDRADQALTVARKELARRDQIIGKYEQVIYYCCCLCGCSLLFFIVAQIHDILVHSYCDGNTQCVLGDINVRFGR